MSRGITQDDVWKACDALLMAGERPTIERVRLTIGRGSPNTVSPLLDTWFRSLGTRIQDPRAFAVPPDIPDPVQQAARHFWETAQAESRRDFDLRLQESLVALKAELQAAQDGALAAQQQAAEVRQALARSEAAGTELRAVHQAERSAHAATVARLDEARQQTDEWRQRCAEAQRQVEATLDQARQDVALAQERAAGAERRAALEIEHERQQRIKSERRHEQAERKLESVHQEQMTERQRLDAAQAELRGQLQRLQDQLNERESVWRAALQAEQDRTAQAKAAMAIANDALAVAAARASVHPVATDGASRQPTRRLRPFKARRPLGKR